MKSQILKFGFEIEGEFGDEVQEKMETWGDIKGDGSIHRCPESKHSPSLVSMAEFASNPITYGTHMRKVNTIFNYLLRMKKAGKFHWNSSCGFHIHTSFSNARPTELMSKEFMQFFADKLRSNFKTVYTVRGANSYCKIPKKETFDDERELENWMRNERYSFINMHPALSKHGTIEFRIFPSNTPNSMKKYLLFTLETINEFLDKQDSLMRRTEKFEIERKPRRVEITTQAQRNSGIVHESGYRSRRSEREVEFAVRPYQRRTI